MKVARLAVSALFILIAGCGFLVATGHQPRSDKGNAGFFNLYRTRTPCPPRCQDEEYKALAAAAKEAGELDKTLPLVTTRYVVMR